MSSLTSKLISYYGEMKKEILFQHMTCIRDTIQQSKHLILPTTNMRSLMTSEKNYG